MVQRVVYSLSILTTMFSSLLVVVFVVEFMYLLIGYGPVLP